MFYLITQSQNGHRLVDFSDRTEDLLPQVSNLANDNAASLPVIYDEKAMRAAYLVDGFGIIAQENDGYLVLLDDL